MSPKVGTRTHFEFCMDPESGHFIYKDRLIGDLLDILDDGSREHDTVLIRVARLGAACVWTLTAGNVPTLGWQFSL